ncbi:AMP-binding protein [Streptomyces sp. NPDC051569]|uniref:AMP-binding protein n=1 Tax=Streptomyces sp. NPDC051569 TaxID=3365661 RepID=UPI0037A3E1F5
MADRTTAVTQPRPPAPLREGETIFTALHQVASALPNHLALMSGGAGGERATRITYSQLLEHVERFADVLTLCGVRRGETVALQMPNCWGSATLLLACLRIGALAVPIPQTVTTHQLEHTLATTGASTCVVYDGHHGHHNAQELLAVSARLPDLRHRIVVGDARTTGALDFERLCRDRSGVWQADEEHPHPLPRDTDNPCLAIPDFNHRTPTTINYQHKRLSTHALTTTHAAANSGEPRTPMNEIFGTTYPLTHPTGLTTAIWQPILTAGTSVFPELWNPAECLDLFEESRVTHIAGPPEHWQQLIEEQRRRPRRLPQLCHATTHGSAPAPLAVGVRKAFGIPLHIHPDH